MILERGNMFDMWGKTDLFLFTSNPIVNKQGLAVMGRGIAKQLASKYPEVRKSFGQLLKEGVEVGCDWVCTVDNQPVGYFMVKDHWAEQAKLNIIQKSVDDLRHWIKDEEDEGNYWRIDLNFPGIGNGHLPRDEVLPIIEQLPDNVHIWEYEA